MYLLKNILWNFTEIILDEIIAKQKLTGLYHTDFETSGSHPVQSTDYPILRKIKKRVHLNKNDEIWDIGCGMGRFLGYYELLGHKGKLIGVEIDKTYYDFCKYIFRKKKNIHIIHSNALSVNIPKEAIVYLYNPFEPDILDQFLSKVDCKKIIYCHDKEKFVFENHKKYFLDDEFFSNLNCGKKVHISIYNHK